MEHDSTSPDGLELAHNDLDIGALGRVLARIDPQNLRVLDISNNPLGGPDLEGTSRPTTPEDMQASRRSMEETLELRRWLHQCLRLERLCVRDAALTDFAQLP